MKLIDADQFGVVSFQGKSEDFAEGVAFILDKIYEAPTVEERPRGKWKNGACTNCGAECFEDDYMRDIETEFCHRCGADMRQKEEVKQNDTV